MIGSVDRSKSESTTGINTKNVLAMAHGIPLITTTSGAQGLLHGNAGWSNNRTAGYAEDVPFLVRDDAYGFASAIAAVCSDRALAARLALAGMEHAEEHYSERVQLHDVIMYLAHV
jgi:glycosyltransferase involved in cell wall biosynthesis